MPFLAAVRHDHDLPVRGLLPPLPWVTGPAGAAADGESVVMASVLRLRRLRDVPAFLRSARDLRAAFRDAPGAVRLSLAAIPARRTFWTLSQWTSDDALRAYAADLRHTEVMRRFRPRMAGSTFVTWTTAAAERPAWTDAHERVRRARVAPARQE